MRPIDADALIEYVQRKENALRNELIVSAHNTEICNNSRIRLSEVLSIEHIIKYAPTVERPRGEWISVEDRLPKRRMECLCLYQFGDTPEYRYYGVLFFNPEEYADNGYVKGPHFNNEGMDDMKVVYWMPLPEKPDMRGEGE